MAVKTFSVGETLTASDTNTYLANSGLVYITSASFSNVANFEVTGFNTTYPAFEVYMAVNQHSGTSVNNLSGQFYNGTTQRATGYYGSGWYSSYNGTSGVTAARNNQSDFLLTGAGVASSGPSIYRFTVRGLSSSKATVMGQFVDFYSILNVNFGYLHDVSETNDRIRFTPSAANVTGFWILYGLRSA